MIDETAARRHEREGLTIAEKHLRLADAEIEDLRSQASEREAKCSAHVTALSNDLLATIAKRDEAASDVDRLRYAYEAARKECVRSGHVSRERCPACENYGPCPTSGPCAGIGWLYPTRLACTPTPNKALPAFDAEKAADFVRALRDAPNVLLEDLAHAPDETEQRVFAALKHARTVFEKERESWRLQQASATFKLEREVRQLRSDKATLENAHQDFIDKIERAKRIEQGLLEENRRLELEARRLKHELVQLDATRPKRKPRKQRSPRAE